MKVLTTRSLNKFTPKTKLNRCQLNSSSHLPFFLGSFDRKTVRLTDPRTDWEQLIQEDSLVRLGFIREHLLSFVRSSFRPGGLDQFFVFGVHSDSQDGADLSHALVKEFGESPSHLFPRRGCQNLEGNTLSK